MQIKSYCSPMQYSSCDLYPHCLTSHLPPPTLLLSFTSNSFFLILRQVFCAMAFKLSELIQVGLSPASVLSSSNWGSPASVLSSSKWGSPASVLSSFLSLLQVLAQSSLL